VEELRYTTLGSQRVDVVYIPYLELLVRDGGRSRYLIRVLRYFRIMYFSSIDDRHPGCMTVDNFYAKAFH
jgi:hypothetical protein